MCVKVDKRHSISSKIIEKDAENTNLAEKLWEKMKNTVIYHTRM
jgi:hypothetical protein